MQHMGWAFVDLPELPLAVHFGGARAVGASGGAPSAPATNSAKTIVAGGKRPMEAEAASVSAPVPKRSRRSPVVKTCTVLIGEHFFCLVCGCDLLCLEI